jgi:hypothetical protein
MPDMASSNLLVPRLGAPAFAQLRPEHSSHVLAEWSPNAALAPFQSWNDPFLFPGF